MTTATRFGEYLLLQRTALGGMSEVFRAQRQVRRPGEPELALKRLLPMLCEDERVARLFLREVEALRRIDHPVVLPLVDAGEHGGVPFVVMPWVHGANLRQILRSGDSDAPQQPLPVEAALWLGSQLAAGLAEAHAVGVVHRDVSPSNILVDMLGSVYLIDFGIARVVGLAQTTHGQGLRGKWAYAAPEQIAGQTIDFRTDLFTFASVLIEALVGQAPFADVDRESTLARIGRAEPLRWPQLVEPLDEVDELLRAMLARDPDHRPGATGLVAQILQRALVQVGDPQGLRAKQQLAARTRGVKHESAAAKLLPAELRGEDVTNPQLDPDATQVRMDQEPPDQGGA
ncbi:MAG: serine/threonine protein kinase [Deltaproteobacteria bacterium]|nr:serine/threonine protein kinase [Deltaproteobacteria bacterium]